MNYTTLQEELKTWLIRPNLADSAIQRFIELAEVRMKRKLVSVEMEDTKYLNLVSGEDFYTLPSDFKSLRRVSVSGDEGGTLRKVSPEIAVTLYHNSTETVPRAFTIVGRNIRLAPTPGEDIVLTIDYLAFLTQLSLSNSTNWVTENYEDLYLYMSLAEGFKYLQDWVQVKEWEQRASAIFTEIEETTSDTHWSGNSTEIVSV